MSDIKMVNRTLARAIRTYVRMIGLNPNQYQPNGRLWARAKRMLKAGKSIEQAAWDAVDAEVRARATTKAPKVTRKPVTQVQAPARKLNAQQERVRKGEVMRDSQGRIMSRVTQELMEFLLTSV